jgi:hypothetical protein
LLEDLQIPA